MNTCSTVVAQGLCHGCGTCAAVCPVRCVAMRVDRRVHSFAPVVDRSACTECGRCLAVCPGRTIEIDRMAAELFGDADRHPLLGRHLHCHQVHAADITLRRTSSSGGLVTALLVFTLERGLIQGALVTRMRADQPLIPETFIARTPEEIRAAAGSKYCPVAANEALRELMGAAGSFAVVGLPCHIHGVRKAERLNPQLAERIVLRIGIACSLNYTFAATTAVLRRLFAAAPHDVERIEYRGGGWPGRMRVRLKSGREHTAALETYYPKLGPFALPRCLLCTDMLAELADISCGDAWLPRLSGDRDGTSFAVVRTQAAEDVLQQAAVAGAIVLHPMSAEEIASSQRGGRCKKRLPAARHRFYAAVGRPLPECGQTLERPGTAEYLQVIREAVTRPVFAWLRARW